MRNQFDSEHRDYEDLKTFASTLEALDPEFEAARYSEPEWERWESPASSSPVFAPTAAELHEFFTPHAHGGRFPGRFRYGQGLGHRRRHPRMGLGSHPRTGFGWTGEVSTEAESCGRVPYPREFINPKIDVHAQYALIRMSKGDFEASADALGMLSAVETGKLAGIYKEDQRFPALRARSMGLGWWQLIPKGEDAALIQDVSPFIVFRDSVRSLPQRLDPALRKAWSIARSAAVPQISIGEATKHTRALGLRLSRNQLEALRSGKTVSIANRPQSEIARFTTNIRTICVKQRQQQKKLRCKKCEAPNCIILRSTPTLVVCLCFGFPLLIQIRGCNL